ncbi:hypothetical protein PRIPAC_77687 [Pristionchus pacificus]|nr:hypothetical protein PRIPAC_77687 [Pristionchus pacificus]
MKQVKSMMSDLLRACKYLNSAGIIHRDVKPENMCIDDNWKLTLLDFGFARVIDRNNQMTEERGTHPYMSIEMIQEWRGVYDEKVDVWSIGAILCELLTGETFFTAENVKHPLDAAIQKLGPVPNSVLDQISDRTVCIHFKKHSERAERINFSDYLNDNVLTWLQDSIRENEKDLHDFIDYALQFEPALRMSVDFALAHGLLVEVRDYPGEVVYEGSIPEEEPLPDGDEGMEECKRRIRREINAAPRFLE